MQNWFNKIILITGAGSGIGQALAKLFAQEGAKLILTGLHAEDLDATCSQLGNSVLLSKVSDVSKKEDWLSLVEEIQKKTDYIDVIINNAGVSAFDFFNDMPEEMFDKVMNVNLNGVVYGCRYLLPLLEKSPRGMIVNISSIFGLICMPMATPYHASKFAVRGFTEGLKQDLLYQNKNIDVICVMPGGVKTNIVNHGETSKLNKNQFAQHFNKIARTSPDKAAKVIGNGMRKRTFRVLIGPDAKFVNILYKVMPTHYYKVFNFLFEVKKFLP